VAEAHPALGTPRPENAVRIAARNAEEIGGTSDRPTVAAPGKTRETTVHEAR